MSEKIFKTKKYFLITCLLLSFSFVAVAQQYQYLFIGTYAPADSNDIFVYRFNENTGQANFISAVSGIENPSYLAFSPNHHYLYSVKETHDSIGGGVYAYGFDAHTGKLSYIDQQLSHGKDPCHLIVDHTGHWLLVANYSSGNFSLFPIQKNGGIGNVTKVVQHEGHGVNPSRQKTPHVHFVNIAPNNRDVFVSDLGLDKVFTYELNATTGHLSAGNPPYISVTPGAGPRHQAFSPDGKFLYLIQEIGGKITAFKYQPGKLTTIQTVNTYPENFKGRIWAADIHLSPDGKFLYGSNRDDLNDIVIFSVNQQTGRLTYVGRQSTGGKTPRNFVITPNGKFLLAAHQNSDDITILKRDQQTGLLTPTSQVIHVPHAVCLKMIGME